MRSHTFQTATRIVQFVIFWGICWNLPAQILASGSADALTFRFQQPSSPIKVSTNLVTVPVAVTDAEGQTITDLTAEDFQIAEDGQQEEIFKLVTAGESPLRLVLVFDLSGSIHPLFEFERTAASRFIEKVWKPGDTVSLITVSNKPEICIADSATPEEVLSILSDLQPVESATAFFDSVVAAAELQEKSTASSTRQATVIFSDGEDNRSDDVFVDAMASIRHSNTVVYAINPSGASIRLNAISRKGQEWLAALAGKTGGTAFVSNNPSDLYDIYDRIAFELRAQYLLSYYSSNTYSDGSFRSISVTIPGKPDLHVRAREGYYAIGMMSEIRN